MGRQGGRQMKDRERQRDREETRRVETARCVCRM